MMRKTHYLITRNFMFLYFQFPSYNVLKCLDIFISFFLFFLFFPEFRDVLPFTIKLPEAIASAKTQKDLEEVAQLGAGSLFHYFTGLKLYMNTHHE